MREADLPGRMRARLDARRWCATLIVALTAAATCGCTDSELSPASKHSASERSGEETVSRHELRVAGDALAGSARFEVTGVSTSENKSLAEEPADSPLWKTILEVRVAGAAENLPAVAGKVRLDGEKLVFEPQFPLRAGMTYKVTFHADKVPGWTGGASDVVTQEFMLPAPPAEPSANVVQVYPSQRELPENLLRFYIHFSAPMSRGEAYERIQLLDGEGKVVELPFLELDEELWNESGTRFTLLFDPGRIKQELRPRADVGSPLRAGETFTLVVSREWHDAKGQPLEREYRREFTVSPRDETQPDVKTWKITAPAAGSRDPLEVVFNEPLDHAMAERVLLVVTDHEELVAGHVDVTDDATHWRFVPDAPWGEGDYQIAVESVLEDRAGNSLARPFEVDLTRPAPETAVPAIVRVPFHVGSAAK